MENPGAIQWQSDLEADEKLLWQGRPAPPFIWRGEIKFLVGIFALGAVFAAKALVDEMQSQYPHLLSYVLVLGCAIGAMFAVVWIARLEHRKTFYALSNKRAFIAFHHPIFGRKVKVYPINAKSPVKYDGNIPGNVTFATKQLRMKHGITQTLDVGFRQIDHGAHVFALVKEVQSQQD